EALHSVFTRDLWVEGLLFRLQFNPARMVSAAAKVDALSIGARPCFLCAQNRPMEQKPLPLDEDFDLLVNPFPIFSRHFTLTQKGHCRQEITGRLRQMLHFAQLLPDDVVFYNGPKCGASAPDHAHFQSGNAALLPLVADPENAFSRFGKLLIDRDLKLWAIEDGFRRFWYAEAKNPDEIVACMELLFSELLIKDGEYEPGMNLLARFENTMYKFWVYPRAKHRPWQYDAAEADRLLISPASVEFGGLIPLAREEDFWKMDAELLRNVLHQVGISAVDFEYYSDIVAQF
ncbi:MAG: hypothetical protein RIS47_263, partial [Bacteroidota bacterium]